MLSVSSVQLVYLLCRNFKEQIKCKLLYNYQKASVDKKAKKA